MIGPSYLLCRGHSTGSLNGTQHLSGMGRLTGIHNCRQFVEFASACTKQHLSRSWISHPVSAVRSVQRVLQLMALLFVHQARGGVTLRSGAHASVSGHC